MFNTLWRFQFTIWQYTGSIYRTIFLNIKVKKKVRRLQGMNVVYSIVHQSLRVSRWASEGTGWAVWKRPMQFSLWWIYQRSDDLCWLWTRWNWYMSGKCLGEINKCNFLRVIYIHKEYESTFPCNIPLHPVHIWLWGGAWARESTLCLCVCTCVLLCDNT